MPGGTVEYLTWTEPEEHPAVAWALMLKPPDGLTKFPEKSTVPVVGVTDRFDTAQGGIVGRVIEVGVVAVDEEDSTDPEYAQTAHEYVSPPTRGDWRLPTVTDEFGVG